MSYARELVALTHTHTCKAMNARCYGKRASKHNLYVVCDQVQSWYPVVVVVVVVV